MAIATGRPIYYFDESRVDNWCLQARSWSPKYSNNYVVKNTQLWSLTLYGALGTEGYVVFGAKGCNSDNLALFVPVLEKACGKPNAKGKPFLIVDQHGSHRKMLSWLQRSFEVLFQAPQSSPFNCVEGLWSFIKREHRQSLAENPLMNRTEGDFRANLMTISERVAKANYKGLARGNIRYLE